MNTIQDSHKRTSISQLLNPSSDSSVYSHAPHLPSPVAVSQYQHAQHQSQANYNQPIESESTFHLREASWEPSEDRSAPKRRVDNVPGPGRPYQLPPHPHMHAEPNGDMVHRQGRSRMDEPGNYGMPPNSWPSQADMSNPPYGSSVVAPMYSDERTALSGDYPANTQYNHPSQNFHPQPQQLQGHHNSSLQHAERASVRIAARFTAPLPGQPMFEVPMHHPAGIFLYHAPAPLPPQKRPSTEEGESAPKTKKAKTKAKTTEGNGSSKRGYNARKRSEAAQIAAQNAQLMPTVSYASAPADKGKEKTAESTMRIVTGDQGQNADSATQLHPELQFARCMSNRYRSEQFPRCVSCTRRWAGDTCRFQGIRFFLKDNQRNIVGVSFVENQQADAPNMHFPSSWNVPLTLTHIRRTKRTIAHALLPTLRQELQHLNYPEIIRRTRESEVRATCDTCMTSIFSSSWMCRLCGREACAECFEQVKDLTEDRPGATQSEIASLQARRDKHAHSNPFFLSCTRRNEHHAKDFSPMSRFCKAELAQAIKDMEAMLKEPDVDALPDIGAIDPSLQAEQSNGTALGDGSSSIQATDSQTGCEKSAQAAEPSAPSNGPSQAGVSHPESAPVLAPFVSQVAEPSQSAPAVPPSTDHPSSEIPSHHTLMIPDSQLTEEIFRPLWAKGEPIVVTGLLPKFQLQWTPEYFVQKYNSQSCLILECQTDLNKRVTVGEFFSWFGKYEGRVECWKLKDWPPSTDFKTAFPELFEDFSRAVPVPNYVRRDGALNIASHFPSNTVAPDLGPKMYNAMSSFESAGSKGSTRIHMDMADAVNIMTYASPSPDGKPGCAVWDLFRAQDAEKLRHFLKKKFKGAFQHDPIHSQQFYLDSQLRKELYDTVGIKSYRVYQKPGEAIFIPAGCAHQVCNLADCIKVAVDFVSPENIDRCEKLTREFREQNQSMAWKEDVLQLRTMMWFAWLSCSRQEKEVED
ncbi:Clavaminate synthase-like protein [Rhizopogon vinicolor AM-OR11-026]|uniref:Clavaminate synthase-like protein n=1 Tax=Rhizopogon vinicolor AM-OR11-026 TaxID=1314800 RepID=A0A1B7N2T9_9AGAM|nr:Clavaminate synthase-like protein [Rhizopogon vinicolor AM-OR11-026]